MMDRIKTHIISDLSTIKEMLEDFETEVGRESGVQEILDKLIDKYSGDKE